MASWDRHAEEYSCLSHGVLNKKGITWDKEQKGKRTPMLARGKGEECMEIEHRQKNQRIDQTKPSPKPNQLGSVTSICQVFIHLSSQHRSTSSSSFSAHYDPITLLNHSIYTSLLELNKPSLSIRLNITAVVFKMNESIIRTTKIWWAVRSQVRSNTRKRKIKYHNKE